MAASSARVAIAVALSTGCRVALYGQGAVEDYPWPSLQLEQYAVNPKVGKHIRINLSPWADEALFKYLSPYSMFCPVHTGEDAKRVNHLMSINPGLEAIVKPGLDNQWKECLKILQVPILLESLDPVGERAPLSDIRQIIPQIEIEEERNDPLSFKPVITWAAPYQNNSVLVAFRRCFLPTSLTKDIPLKPSGGRTSTGLP
ncbi:MAG: hypothetical protein WC824_11950, partial [Bacteroidota bacterium]